MAFNTIQGWMTQNLDIWQIFGYLNVLISTGLLLFLGFRRGWSRPQWSLLVSSFVFGTGLGSMLIPSIMGALLGGLVTYTLVKRLLCFQHSTADLFVYYMIIFIGFGRLGCLFSGCCFGTPTTLPWGISYASGNLAHWLHFHSGQLPSFQHSSLMIHPVQLYESLALLLIALPTTLFLRHRQASPRLIMSAFLSGYFFLRFLLEFLRDMSNVWWSEIMVGPLSVFQLFLLIMSGGILVYGATPDLRFKSIPIQIYFPRPGVPLLLSFFASATLLLSPYFQRIQLVLLLTLLPMTLYFYLLTLNERSKALVRSPILATSLGLILLFGGNTFFENGETPIHLLKKPVWLYGINEHSEKLVRIGNQHLSFNDYQRVRSVLAEEIGPTELDSTMYEKALREIGMAKVRYYGGGGAGDYSYVITGCGGESATHYLDQNGLQLGAEISYQSSERRTNYIGIQLSQVNHAQRIENGPETKTRFSSGMVYAQTDGRWLGFGLSGGVSRERVDRNDLEYYVDPITTTTHGLIPGAYLRIGPRKFNLELGANDRNQILPGPRSGHLNMNFGLAGDMIMQMGYTNLGAFSPEESFPFLGVKRLPLGSKFSLDVSGVISGGVGGHLILSYLPEGNRR